MTRTGDAAIAWGKNQVYHPSQNWYRWCLVFVQDCFDVPARQPSAGAEWIHAQGRHIVQHGSEIPAAVPVHWDTSGPSDHIATSIGGGLCLSTDVARTGKVDIVSIDSITRNWNCRLQGWTEYLEGVRIWTPPKPGHLPQVSLAYVDEAAHKDPQSKQGHGVHPIHVRRLELALRGEGLLNRYYGDGSYGSATIAAYAAWQRRLGYSGKDANGIPGMQSLKALGARHGFAAMK